MADPSDPGSPRKPGRAASHADEDAIDRAAADETQAGPDGVGPVEGAAFPSPAGGAVVAPGGSEAPPERPEGTDGAGDELRGGAGGGPLPPGTGMPLPEGDARMAAPEERDAARAATDVPQTGRPHAGAGSVAPGLYAADGPTAREAGVEGAPPDDGAGAAMRELGVQAGQHGWVLWVMGGAALVAGILALALPLVATLAATILTASLLLASGAVGLFTSFRRRDGGAIAAGFALSLLAAVTGIVMLVAPLAGVVALGTLIIAWFAASGVVKLWYGFKAEGMRGRGWMIASGALSLVLAIWLWAALPGAALWLPGVLLGVDLIIYGTTLIALAVFGRPKIDAERLS